MKRFTFILPLLFCALTALASTALGRPGTTRARLFDSGWLFMRYGLQPDGTTLAEPSGLQKPEVADSAWTAVNLPHDYAITGPFRIDLAGETGKLPYQGIGWYRKHFTLSPAPGERTYIEFDGAMANARVWLNGHYVGEWPYGYSSFRLDLTPYIQPGRDNVLAVRLDTERWESRWYSGAGIYRHVWLVSSQPVHVAHWGTYITTPVVTDERAEVRTEVRVENFLPRRVNAEVRTRYCELDSNNTVGRQVAQTSNTVSLHASSGENTVVSTAVIQQPRRWDITSPHRYVAITEVVVDGQVTDTYHTPFGVRTIEFTADRGFLLNGRKVDIKGVCLHHDLGALGAAFNRSALERQLRIMQQMGCNAIRTSHNPPAPELLELTDRMGLLVWDEAFDAWQNGKRRYDYSQHFADWHERDIQALVRRDRNHPSVVIWSIGNEVMEQRDVELTKHLADVMRRADPTRPVSNGYNDPNGGRASGAAAALDLMGVNYFFGEQAKWEADPRYVDMPTIGSETSSCVSSRGEYFFGTHTKDWQISSYDLYAVPWGCSPDAQFRTQARFPRLLGEFVWTGFDYLGEPTPYSSAATNLLNFRNDPSRQQELKAMLDSLTRKTPPSRSSYFGIVDLAGFPKDRYYLYQSHWRPDLPMAHILPHWNWPERVDSIVPVHVYTSGTEAELFLNGRSLGRRANQAGQDFRLVWDSVRYTPGELRVVAYKNGRRWAESSVRTTGRAARLNMQADRTEVQAGTDDLFFVTVSVTDRRGLTVPRACPLIRFSVEGAGEIVATDNGNAIDYTPFQSHERKAYNGLALVIVRARPGATGPITVKAESDGLRTASVRLQVK